MGPTRGPHVRSQRSIRKGGGCSRIPNAVHRRELSRIVAFAIGSVSSYRMKQALRINEYAISYVPNVLSGSPMRLYKAVIFGDVIA